MNYKISLILFITMLWVLPAAAQDDRYRVEILVLTHLKNTEEAAEIPWLKDYSSALDFLTPEPEPEPELDSNGNPIPQEEVAPITDPLTGEILLADQEEEIIDPNEVVHIEEKSEAMADAWRRLRLSGPYRPLQYLSWEQGRDEPFPLLRVHDLEAVLVDDPYADLRAMLEAGLVVEHLDDGASDDQAAPPPQSFQNKTIDPSADGLAAMEDKNALNEEEPMLPDPTVFYSLDGTATLVRTRFLHLNLELELREAVYEPRSQDDVYRPAPTASLVSIPSQAGQGPVRPSSYRVHKLLQSRQVKTGRMEYFDGPAIAVLAYITPVTLPDPGDD